MRYCMPMHVQLMHHPSMCTNEWRPTAAPSVFPAKSVGGKLQLHSKRSSNGPYPENFLTISGYFECNTFHVTALHWLKKKERR